MAIDLPVRVSVSKGECPMDEFTSFIVKYASAKLGVREEYCIRVNSNVPVASGLKSNSAVAVGVTYALAKATGAELSKIDVIRIAAEATKVHGSSITGAFDDASASLLGGVVLTDNRLMKVIKHINPPNDVVVVITGFKEGKKPININALRDLRSLYHDLMHWALEGKLWEAATINGIMVAKALGYVKQLSAISEALGSGALAAGVSGNGPSIYAVFKVGEEGPFIDYINKHWGYITLTKPIPVLSI